MGPLHPSLELPASLSLNPLSSTTSHLLSLLFTSGYVGSIYLSNHLAGTPKGKAKSVPKESGGEGSSLVQDGSELPLPPISDPDATSASSDITSNDAAFAPDDPNLPKPGERNHPDTIRRRMKAVGVATGLSLGGVWWVVKTAGGYEGVEAINPTFALLGLALPIPLSVPPLASLPRAVLPYLLAPTLLLGPLYATYLDGDTPSVSYSRRDGLQIKWDRFGGGSSDGWGLAEWRNYVVGPLTEELVFRSCLLAVALLSQTSMRTMVFATPLWFGIAHAHHAWETYTKGGRTASAALQAVAGSVFQLTYTSLFGWFATYSYLRTASVLPALTSHVFCNLMGIYLPHVAVKRHSGKKGVIWALYAAGIAGFVLGLRQL